MQATAYVDSSTYRRYILNVLAISLCEEQSNDIDADIYIIFLS